MSHRLEVYPDDVWAASVADLLVERLRPGLRLCLPTGDTVRPLYRELAVRTDLEGVQLFLLDEFGGLPAGDPGRCEVMIAHDLLDRLSPAPSIIGPDVDTPDPVQAARRYGRLVADGGIDLALVGLGGNGHVGMNEPGSSLDSETRVVELARSTVEHAREYGATTAPGWGITIGLSELLRAGELWLLVTGEHKSEILTRSLEGRIGPEVPASLLRQHSHLSVLADGSAALGLRRG